MLLGALFDLGATPGDVEQHNAHLVPAPIQTPGGTAPGFAFAGRF